MNTFNIIKVKFKYFIQKESDWQLGILKKFKNFYSFKAKVAPKTKENLVYTVKSFISISFTFQFSIRPGQASSKCSTTWQNWGEQDSLPGSQD